MVHLQDGYKATGFKHQITCRFLVELVQTKDACVKNDMPGGRSAEMDQPDGAMQNRTVIPGTASELATRLARNCRARRASMKISQAELSKRAGVAASHLSHIENGRGNPTLEILETIAEALDCSVVDLLSD